MKKISLNLDQETPFALKQAMFRTSSFSQKAFSPLKKHKENIKPKENFSHSKDFSGISPIKIAQKESDTASFRSFLPLNQINANPNLSKYDSFCTSDSVSQVSMLDKRKNELSKASKNTPSFSILYDTIFAKNKQDDMMNYHKTNQFGYREKYSNNAQFEENKNVNKNLMLKNKQQPRSFSNKFNCDNANISEYVEDFENSYNLQMIMLNKEYRSQYFFIALFILVWVYFISFVITKWLNALFQEEENLFSFFGYLKFTILLGLIIYSRISSFESK